MTELRTERLILRRARPEDLAAIHAVLSDEQAMAHWSTPPHETLEESRKWLDSMLESTPELSEDFMITCDGEVIGKIGCFPAARDRLHHPPGPLGPRLCRRGDGRLPPPCVRPA
jgi:RimJ/RimL family protein N-acetyltransferase